MREWRTEKEGFTFVWTENIADKLFEKHVYLSTGEAEEIFLEGSDSFRPHPQHTGRFIMTPVWRSRRYFLSFIVHLDDSIRILTCYEI